MSDPVGNFAGLGSGFDYTSLVDQIIQNDSAPATAMQAKVTAANAQLSAYGTYRGLLATLDTAAQSMRDGTAFGAMSTTVNGGAVNGRALLSATAGAGASPGSYAVQVLQTAQAEKLSGSVFGSTTAALGLSGQFTINNKTVTIAATDTLSQVRDKINAVNAGASPSGVSAAIISDSSTAFRLVLTSQSTGAAGIDLIDGSQGIAQQLGWIDNTTTLKHLSSAGAQSDNFTSASATIASLRGLTGTGPQTITVGGQSVSIDLGTDSLNSIAAKLSALTGIQATVQSSVVNGVTQYSLDVRNTTNFVDAGNTLGQLGIVTSGRSSTAQQLQSAALTAGDASTPATASTLLSSLWNGGSASGAQAGDTLTIKGTRGDGTAVSVTFTIGAGSTVQDLLNALNDPTTGFGGGTRPAAASVDASGHIVLTDGTAGSSALSLQITANNESGGRLDLGAFGVQTAGRSRQLVAGADAKFSIDGVQFTRASNTITDVIANTTLSLTGADPSSTAIITIDRSAQSAQAAMQGFVDAYNKLIDFAQQQQTVTPNADGTPGTPQPLYNDSILRLARSGLSTSLLTSVFGTAPDMATAASAGVSITKDGHLTLDADKFNTAFTTRFTDVQKLFMEQGISSNSNLGYGSSTAATQAGVYDVAITQAATQATVLGTGFSGTYSAASPDTLVVTDPGTNASVQVQLTNGMTTDQIVEALNAAFKTAQTQTITAGTAFTDATGAAPAAGATLLTDLHGPSGAALGVASGDTIDFSGVRPDGTAYALTYAVTGTSTLGDLVGKLQNAIGGNATVSLTNGVLSVKAATSGKSSLTLTVAAHNEGGGSLDFGGTPVTTTGRGTLSMTASSVGGQLQIAHNTYGVAGGVTIAFAGGDSAQTAQLGLASGTVNGLDVAGTIGGYPATGTGRQLVGNTGSPVDGLSLFYADTVTGAVGNINLSQGLGAVIDRLIKSWTDDGTGTIANKETSLKNTITNQQKRYDDFTARMDLRRQTLLKQFLAMDTAVSKLKSQSASFLSALSSGSSSSSS